MKGGEDGGGEERRNIWRTGERGRVRGQEEEKRMKRRRRGRRRKKEKKTTTRTTRRVRRSREGVGGVGGLGGEEEEEEEDDDDDNDKMENINHAVFNNIFGVADQATVAIHAVDPVPVIDIEERISKTNAFICNQCRALKGRFDE